MSDYSDSGFDDFLSRSIDDVPQATLDSQGPSSLQTRFDASQVSGIIGDNVRVKSLKDFSVGNSNIPDQFVIHGENFDAYDIDGNRTIAEGRLVGSKILAKVSLTNPLALDGSGGDDVQYPLSALTFTIPNGVTSIKITLNLTGSANFSVYRNQVKGSYLNAEFTNSANIGFGTEGLGLWFKDVQPGEQYTYVLGVVNAAPVTITPLPNQPIIFMVEGA